MQWSMVVRCEEVELMSCGSFNQVYVQCPFYKHDEGKRITCEGLIDKSSITVSYISKRDYEIQLKTFCCEHYQKCEVYRMLMQKYEEEEC